MGPRLPVGTFARGAMCAHKAARAPAAERYRQQHGAEGGELGELEHLQPTQQPAELARLSLYREEGGALKIDECAQ